jgi:response regulator of citrate/malate metabolism
MSRGGLAGEVETLLISAVVIAAHVNGKPKTAAEVGRALGIPRITVRRKLEELVRRKLLKKDRTRYLGVDSGDYEHIDKAIAIIKRAAQGTGGS